jgi:hypothetical protein
MNNPVFPLLDGLAVAGMHWGSVLGILLLMSVSQFLLYSIFRGIFGDRFTAGEFYSLSLAGWLLPALLISLFWYTSAATLSPQYAVIVTTTIVILAGTALFVRIPDSVPAAFKSIFPALLLLTGVFIILRLAYVSKAILPMYFDSAQHFRYISVILSGLQGASAGGPSLVNYYHLGFHFLAAFIAFISQAEIADAMLVLGQFILAVMPFSVFIIVRHETRSNSAGFFAFALAAFGWYMPAHAVDWGKYPALASLALLPFVLSLVYLRNRYKFTLSRSGLWTLNALIIAGVVMTVFLHSRSAIVFGILALTWLIASVWGRFARLSQLSIVIFFLLVVIAEISFIQTKGILGPLFDPYGMKAVLITASVFLLPVFAYQAYPVLVFSCIVSISLFLASLFIPLVDVIPGLVSTTLLDRPFVEMILYLPLTFLGGFGLAGLEQNLEKIVWSGKGWVPARMIGALFMALVAVNALFQYDLYPSDCCSIVSEDDIAAIHWMDQNIPRDAHILVASTQLNVLPTDEFQGSAGSDAGTWITPLIHRISTFMPFNTDFSQPQILGDLCRRRVDYIYVGGTGLGFDASSISAHPDGYNLVFEKPKAKIFEVTGCS